MFLFVNRLSGQREQPWSLGMPPAVSQQLKMSPMAAAPVISDARLNTPRTGRASVTLSGVNFLSAGSTMTVRVASAVCLTTSWSTVTSVACVLRSTSSASPNAVVTIGISSGTGVVVFSFDGISLKC